MPYPREVTLDAETESRLIAYLENEILIHYAERDAHINDLIRWQKEYWATPTHEKATFPFHNASTLIIPITAIAVESIHARTMTTRFALDDLVSAHPVAGGAWEDVAVPVERFMNHETQEVMKVRKGFNDCFLSCIKYGTMVGKVFYEKKTKNTIREVNGVEQEIEITIKDGAQFDSLPEARFLMPFSDMDPQVSRWCGEEHSHTPYDVMLMEAGGMFKPGTIVDANATAKNNGGPGDKTPYLSRLHSWINRTQNIQTGIGGNKVEREQEKLEKRETQWPKRIDWLEIKLAFDIDNSGKQREIVVHYHRDARYLMSVRYNWYSDLRRDYRTGVYFPIEHRWTGIGVAKQNEQFQKEITVQHRQKIDNGTLVNMRMLKVHKLSGYNAKEPVFPGKMWFLDDMSHVEAFQMGEIYPSGYQNEQSALIYSQQRTGVNEVTLGMPQVGTPGTATSDLARIQEGNKKFDFVYDNFNQFAQDIIMDIADTIQQFGPRQLAYLDVAENGDMIRQFFQMPSSYIRDNIILRLKVTTQRTNRLLDRQNWQQITQGIQMYLQGMIQLAEAAQNPQLMQMLAMKGMASATEAFEQFLETYDIRNVDRIAFVEIKKLLEAQANGNQGGASTNGNGNNGSSPSGPPNRMGDITSLFSFNGGSGNS